MYYGETEIETAMEEYASYHEALMTAHDLTVEVYRCYDGYGRVTGFTLSVDSDGHSYGCDETYGECG